MLRDIKDRLCKKLSIPIKAFTFVLLGITFLSIVILLPVSKYIEKIYSEYGLEEQIPIIIKGITDLFQNNIVYVILFIILMIIFLIILNVLWNRLAKHIINSTDLEESILEKKVKTFNIITIIITSVLSAILIISFLIILFIFIKAFLEVYMGSFLFEAYSL